MNAIRLTILLAAAVIIPACGGGSTGARGPAGPPGVTIQSITADPPVLRPAAATTLTVSATDGTGGVLTYGWSAPAGALSSASGNPVDWTAPDATGSFLVGVTVSNAGGATAVGYVSLLVSVGPTTPVITSVNPGTPFVGDVVRITGAGFGAFQGSSTLTFLGIPAGVTSWSDTVIVAIVPPGSAGSGDALVTVAGVASSPGPVVISPCIPVSMAANDQDSQQIVPDGSGGAIIVWADRRSGVYDIYAQRINAAGVAQWAANGVAVCTAVMEQELPQVVSDGAGGAIVAWRDGRSLTDFDIYAQRVDGSGAVQWTADGVAVCSAADVQTHPHLVPDGSGGAIIAWQDFRTGSSYDIYAQRLNGAGVPQWAANGIPISAATDWQDSVRACSDGSGGAIVAWRDRRSGTYDIYAQRVNSAGAVQWTADGVALCTASGIQDPPRIVSDGSNGAIVVWVDHRNPTQDVFAQRVNGAGVPQWTADGIAVCPVTVIKADPQIESDGAGGAIVAWNHASDIFAQRLNAAGALQWTSGGVPLCAAPTAEGRPQIASDGSGGAIVTWEDDRGASTDIYAQRVNSAGTVQWAANGVPVITAADDQTLPVIAPGAAGATIIAWRDLRNGSTSDLFAQRLSAAGAP